MRHIVFISIVAIFAASCQQNDSKQKELELKEKEIALKERALALKEKTTNSPDRDSESAAKEVSFKTHRPCSFDVSLPKSFKLEAQFDDRSSDYCDFNVKTKDGFTIIELHSLLKSRFELETIDELYAAAIKHSELDISYKTKKGNWFVISGTNKKTGKIVYWKRVVGESFISDLDIEYPINRKSEIEPHIGTISNSFTSQ